MFADDADQLPAGHACGPRGVYEFGFELAGFLQERPDA
jgi:hypothetical protein